MKETINQKKEETKVINNKWMENINEKINKGQKDNKGIVTEVKDDIAIVNGLLKVGMSEMVEFQTEKKIKGIVNFIDNKGRAGITILGDSTKIYVGLNVERLNKMPIIKGGISSLGRVINPLGEAIDGKGILKNVTDLYIENEAPSIIARQPVDEPLETGIKFIDAMIPIGAGQRELIIGDQKTGKTSIAIDTILNQKNKKTVCIYVAIGQKKSSVAKIAKILKQKGCMDYTIIVSASASDSTVMQYLAPYSGCALGEFFMNAGYKSLIIYDDLSKHAVAYRQMSLLLGRPSGREGYPGDVFYLHSRLLERSARLKNKIDEKSGLKLYDGGSLTAFPIIETIAGDVSAYIPTNVISITDGQIFLESDLFNRGIRPAINPGISVSRVGSAAQNKVIKNLAGSLKLELAQFREMEDFARLGLSLDEATLLILEKGARLQALMNQPQYSPVSMLQQITLLVAGLNGLLNDIDLKDISVFERKLSYFLNDSKIFPTLNGVIRHILPESLLVFIINLIKANLIENKN